MRRTYGSLQFAILLAAFLFLPFQACQKPVVSLEMPLQDSSSTRSDPAVKYHGRFDFTNSEAPSFAWSSSSVEAQFTGSSLQVDLENEQNNIYFVALIDSGTPIRFATQSGRHTYTLASNLSSGAHHVLLMRETEAMMGVSKFYGFSFGNGSLEVLPARNQNLRIEVIGDSITCGYGNLGANPCGFTNETESAYASYPQVAARLLGTTPATTICYSGRGLVRSGAQLSTPITDTMPSLYLSVLPYGKSWNFQANPQPDVVVVNLGANDFWNGTTPTNFLGSYVDFLRSLRSRYPNAHLFGAVGPFLGNSPKPYVQSAVSQLQTTGDSKVHFIEFPDQVASNGIGCDMHPSRTTNQLAGEQLANAIRSIMP